MVKNKAGISAIVATVLIILITVAAVSIIWVFIIPMISESAAFDDPGARLEITTRGGYTFYDATQKVLYVQVKRGADEANMIGIEIQVMIEGTTSSFGKDNPLEAPNVNGLRVYELNLSSVIEDGQVPDSVVVIPIFDGNDGGLTTGTASASVSTPSGSSSSSSSNSVNPDGDGCFTDESCDDENDCTTNDVEACNNGVLGSCAGVDRDDGVGCTGGTCQGGVCELYCTGNDCDLDDTFFHGEGVLDDPYMIYNCYQLQNMSYFLGANYELARDVNCSMTNPASEDNSGTIWENGGLGFDPVGDAAKRFMGNFSGNEFEIKGLFIDRPKRYVGLFGIAQGGIIENVGLVGSDITGNSMVGSIVGASSSLIIDNVYNEGSVFGYYYIGGIAGNQGTGTLIDNSYNSGKIESDDYVGGIAGKLSSGVINRSYNTGEVMANVAGISYLGGIVGESSSSSIANSYNSGSLSGYSGVGGIVGDSYSDSINNSYNVGNIFSTTGSIIDYGAGGIIADINQNYPPEILDSYYLDTSCEYQDCDDYGVVWTNEAFTNQANYPSSWDFDSIWVMDANFPYPQLR